MKHRKTKFALGVIAVAGGGTAIPWVAGDLVLAAWSLMIMHDRVVCLKSPLESNMTPVLCSVVDAEEEARIKSVVGIAPDCFRRCSERVEMHM